MITEMNASSTPQWAKDFEREIMTDYNISCTDAIFITGKVCKIVREQKAIDDKRYEEYLAYMSKQLSDSLATQRKNIIDKACEWLDKELQEWLVDSSVRPYLDERGIEDFRKAMMEE